MNIDVKRLIVKYNNKIVGFLEEIENKRIAFQYSEEWIKNGFSISPFFLPLSNEVYITKSLYFSGLFGVFNDSLPDGWGELLVRRKLLKEGINFDKISALTRLSLVSKNGLGGLTYEPTQMKDTTESFSDLDSLAKEVNSIFENNYTGVSFDDIFALGGSSGGTRPKAHLKIDNEDWIVKFPSSMDPKNIGELEYKANTLAKEVGINTNESKLFPSKQSSGYFGAKRFDKEKTKRIHMISLSSLLETTHTIANLDYKILFQVIQKISANQEDLYEAFKRMCFNVLYGNKDDHGKNFAFLYDEKLGGYKLSPAYDITKTFNKLEHEMTVLTNGNPKEEDLMKIANAFNLSTKKCKEIIALTKTVVNRG